MADLTVTVLGVAGFLGFLMVGRMDDANASPFDIFAFVVLCVCPSSNFARLGCYRSDPPRTLD